MGWMRMAAVAGAVSLLWGAGVQKMSFGAWTLPRLSATQLAGVAATVYIACGGYYTLWLAYMTLPRDLRAGIKYLYVLVKLKKATYTNSNVAKMFMENVRKNPNKVALIYEDQKWTFAQIDEYSNRVANLMVAEGYKHGETVALFMMNRPEYVCTWLGCAKVGVVTALINFNLRATPLVHCIQVANAKAVICGLEIQKALESVRKELEVPVYVSGCGDTVPEFQDGKNMDQLLSTSSPTPPLEIDQVGMSDKLVYIYTSGTTGLPKAAIIKHARFLFFCTAAHHMATLKEEDVIYNPLPLYHTAGGMVGIGQVLVFNCTAVIRRKFSASQFWVEAKKHNCTVRVMFGNGVRSQIWEQFTTRFQMPVIAEFYGATEGIANIMNMDGKPGACGFVPMILRHVLPVYLIKVDQETGEPWRDKQGLCIMCKPGEPGEFVGMIKKNDAMRDFHGYADRKATQKKIIQDVWKKGDAAFKSGDILVMDELGYMYFKDRTGDTFRWRGENVSSTEVEGVVSKVADNKDAVVYGVEVPGAEGKAGMAAIVDPEGSLNLTEFFDGMKKNLPPYACPVFLRIMKEIDATGTFKLKKLALQKEGFDRNVIKDKLYFLDGKLGQYVKLTPELFDQITNAKVGL
ncbi:Long-chain fatty acid transport protein 1 [Chionoecetes opilio]|uniref:long-chain-fatty-acid--CoA ligase n=1 Tax=Chionoecetes opilio TaxID=41210 RepID=A0A8J4Y297_CHIOP|nr:Long-chain fatty acid transport protein 1 [Chionoecetes opilio]